MFNEQKMNYFVVRDQEADIFQLFKNFSFYLDNPSVHTQFGINQITYNVYLQNESGNFSVYEFKNENLP